MFKYNFPKENVYALDNIFIRITFSSSFNCLKKDQLWSLPSPEERSVTRGEVTGSR